ncbi:MAG: NUDIX hydrolase [Bauldia sp.]
MSEGKPVADEEGRRRQGGKFPAVRPARPAEEASASLTGRPAVKEREVLYRGWLTLSRVSVVTAAGAPAVREVESHGDGAAVLAYDPLRRVAMLVRQLRVSAFLASGEETTLEAIAGILEDGDPASTARREALEEAGLRLDRLEEVATSWSMPGVSTERLTLFLAEYGEADRIHAGGGLEHESEEIEAVEMPLADLKGALADGTLRDLKTIVLVQALLLRRPELFG